MRWSLALLIVAILLAGCGGSSSTSKSSSPTATTPSSSSGPTVGSRRLTAYVRNAADVTARLRGAHVSMVGAVSSGGKTLALSAEGVSDIAGNKGSMQMQFTGGGQSGEIEMVYDGFVFYMTSELFSDALPGGAKWLKLDVKKSSEAAGLGTSSFQSANPADALESLRASGEVTKLGREMVRGVQTTHYRVIVDPRKVKSDSKLEDAYDFESTPSEVWIDAQSRVRRMKAGYAYTPSGKDRITQTFTIEMYEYGTPVRIEIPAASEVFDATDVASNELKKDLNK